MEVTVAALQTALTDDVAGNVARVTELCREAAGRGAQIILPSELFEGHYFCRTQREADFSRARPTERAALPAPLATMSHVVCTPRPTARTPEATDPRERRLTGFLRRAGREPPDLVVRPRERAAVLLGMRASLVAYASFAPFATLATRRPARLPRN